MKTTRKLLALCAALGLLLCALAPTAQAAGGSCATKYPIILVHGAGFRDNNLLISYWGNIPKALKAQGAPVYFGNTDGWCSVENGAAALKKTVDQVLAKTKSEKVNIIAHSKGGLEARYMISSLGMAGKVASLTTIATPHQGSKAMDIYLGWPRVLRQVIGAFGTAIRFIWGDKHPSFFQGTEALGTGQMKAFNQKNPNKAGVDYQSFAGALHAPASDLILCWPALLIRNVDGENDGMVTVESAKWANFRGVLRGSGYRGVSHLDEVDFRRNDVAIQPLLGAKSIRSFYVALAAELKQKGY